MSVKIVDCTLRDGGYLLDKNPAPSFVKGILEGLARAGVDFVETGFLQTKDNDGSIVYHTPADANRFLPNDCFHTEFMGFCDNSRYAIECLDNSSNSSIRWIRISFAKHEADDALIFCEQMQTKGYLVQFNPMDAISYTDEERAILIKKVNQIKPGSVSIVDTFGAMYLEDLIHIFDQMNELLDPSIYIGLHSHDNLGLSTALAETLIRHADKKGRDIVVDGSLFGMGRGAGNARTELLAAYINTHYAGAYDTAVLLAIIEDYILPLKEKGVQWGYDLPMYICGTEHSHVDNVYHIMEMPGWSTKDMYEVIKMMNEQQRTRYGKGYSKNDFSALNMLYKQYLETKEV